MQGEAIIQYFEERPLASPTIHELSLAIKKSYGWTYTHAKRLAVEGMLRMRRVGGALECTLNARDERAIGALCWASAQRAHHATDDARAIAAHVPAALAIVKGPHGIVVLSEHEHGKHVINGNELRFATATRETMDALAGAVILHGYERFWRRWGETHE